MKPAPLLLAAFAIAGCSAPIATSASPSPASPTTTVTTATPQQFASILSGKESEWRETIEGASDCRYLWVMGGDDVQASTCYVREVTIVMTAGTAAEKLAELTPSSEVKPLVSETIDVLSSIGAVDLDGVCGEAFSDSAPKDTKKCDVAMGELFADYHKLKTVLDQWKPYT